MYLGTASNIVSFSSLDKLASPNKYVFNGRWRNSDKIRIRVELWFGYSKKKCLVVSDLPQEHKGESIRFLRYKWCLKELHSSRNRVWKIWAFLLPKWNQIGGLLMCSASLHLNCVTEVLFLISMGRLFQALITDGRKELKYNVELAWTDSRLFEFLSEYCDWFRYKLI